MTNVLTGTMAAALFILATRLWRYRQQINFLLKQMALLEQEGTNYQLSSYCRIGKTEQLINEINRICQRNREKAAALRKGNESYRESIIGISHDIRTPLTSAKGYTQMLLSDFVIEKEKQRLYISKIEQRIDDVVDLLEQLFEYARLEAEEIELDMKRMNLCNFFADTISLFYDDFIRLGCEPTISVGESPCYITADPNAVKRIIENLIKNALVHGKGDYRFSVGRQDSCVSMTVSNLTDSIESSDIEHIFDRFYTTDLSRTRKLTGLGLAIVKQFTEKMGGTVQATLWENVFTIKVTFPLNT